MTALPDVPTAAEAGLKDYNSYAWLALLAPIIDKLYAALAEALKDPTVRSRFTEQGAEPVSLGPAKTQKFIISETKKWRQIIEQTGIPPM